MYDIMNLHLPLNRNYINVGKHISPIDHMAYGYVLQQSLVVKVKTNEFDPSKPLLGGSSELVSG